MIEVGVREEDRLHVRTAASRDIDDKVWLEVGVDDHRVVRIFVLDEIGVGAEAAVGGDLDANSQSDLRTIRWRSVSRYGSKPACRYMLSGPL